MSDYTIALVPGLEPAFKDLPVGWIKTGCLKVETKSRNTLWHMHGEELGISVLDHLHPLRSSRREKANVRCFLKDGFDRILPIPFKTRLHAKMSAMVHYIDLVSIYLYINQIAEPVGYNGLQAPDMNHIDMDRVYSTISKVDHCYYPWPDNYSHSGGPSYMVLFRGVCTYSCTYVCDESEQIYCSGFFNPCDSDSYGSVSVQRLSLLEEESIGRWQSMVMRDLCIGSYCCLKSLLDAATKFSTKAAKDQQFRGTLMDHLVEFDSLKSEVVAYYHGLHLGGNIANSLVELKFNLMAIAATLWHCFPVRPGFTPLNCWRQHGQISDFIGEEYLRPLLFRLRGYYF